MDTGWAETPSPRDDKNNEWCLLETQTHQRPAETKYNTLQHIK